MTQRDHVNQWIAYTIAMLLCAGLETLVFSRFHPMGVLPSLLPIALTACATLEGPKAGAGFGIAIGAMMSISARGGGWRMVVCSLAGFGVGLLTRYVLRQGLVGHLLCTVLVLLGRECWCVGILLWQETAQLEVLLRVAIPEFLWSLVFAIPIYFLFRFVCRRWGRLYFE